MYLFTKQIDFNAPVPILHQALQIAIYDEYRAQASYQSILDTFGQVAPFRHIVEAETRHINALLPLLKRYQVPIPVNDWYPNVTPAQTLRENCELGVAAEIQNVQMYDHLLNYVSQADIRHTFMNLREASLTNHLPAFRQCAAAQQAISYTNSCTSVGSQPSWLWVLGGIAVGFMVSKAVRTELGAS